MSRDSYWRLSDMACNVTGFKIEHALEMMQYAISNLPVKAYNPITMTDTNWRMGSDNKALVGLLVACKAVINACGQNTFRLQDWFCDKFRSQIPSDIIPISSKIPGFCPSIVLAIVILLCLTCSFIFKQIKRPEWHLCENIKYILLMQYKIETKCH